MSWKSFACVAALGAMTAPAVAAPSLGLVDNGGGSATLQVISDGSGSLAAEISISSTANLTAASIADSVVWDTANPGANPLTGTQTTGLYLDDLGNGNLFVSYGSDVVSAGTYDLLSLTYDGSGTIDALGLVAFDSLLGATDLAATVDVGGPGLAGDFDGSGAVGDGDLTLLLSNWAATVPPVPAGWVGSQPTVPGIGDDELTALLSTWGQSAASGVSVPEPAAALLAMIGVACLGVRRSV